MMILYRSDICSCTYYENIGIIRKTAITRAITLLPVHNNYFPTFFTISLVRNDKRANFVCLNLIKFIVQLKKKQLFFRTILVTEAHIIRYEYHFAIKAELLCINAFLAHIINSDSI